MKERVKILITTLIVCAIAPTAATGEIIFVDTDAGGANDGSSWADAFNYLQDALRVAWPGDKIRIAQGIYKPDQGVWVMPGDREATFQLKNGVTIKGGYAGLGEPNPDDRNITAYETILSGDLDGNDIDVNDLSNLWDEPSRAENSYHVVNGSNTDSNAILDGFTITGGNANGVSYICAGGGMYNDSGSPTLTNCLFVSNSAETGGGIWNRFSKNLILLNCTFRRNQARTWAGGVYNLDSNLCLNNCIFIENLSGLCGGGVDNFYSSLKLFNCKFSGNAADFSGGGIHWDDPFDVIIINCLFVGNSSEYGGAISGEIGLGCPTIIKNCTFSFNLAEGKGGGLHIHLPPAPCVSPQSIKYDWGCYISNCILWGDIPDEIYDTWAVITYSDVEGGWPGEGNIDTDPCFVQLGYWEVGLPSEPPQPPIPPPPPPPPGSPPPPNNEYYTWFEGNYHLLPDSPCIDAGDPCYVAEPNETDLDGKPRVLDGNGDAIAVVDMGAYESIPPIPAEVRITPRTINLASKSKWLTCYIWLPDNYSITDVDSNAIFIFGKIQAESVQVSEKQQVAIAEFSREEVQTILNTGEVELSIIGWLIDGTIFEGKDNIRVIDKGGK